MSEVVHVDVDLRTQATALSVRAEDAFRTLLKSFPVPDDFKTREIDAILDVATWFYSGDQKVTDFMLIEAQQVGQLLSNLPGVVGCFGVGYPFYAIGSDRKPVEVATIGAFISSLRDQLRTEDTSTWVCSTCDVLSSSSLKSGCKSCSKSALKPRNLLSSIPDLDIIVVVDRPQALHEELIQSTLHAAGFFQSDIDIKSAISRSQILMRDIQRKDSTTQHLPIDVHLWDFDDFNQASKAIVEGVPTKLFTRSMYRGWQNDVINHGFDWVFSLTELGEVKPAMKTHLEKHRREFSNKVRLGTIDLVEFLGQASRRAKELLSIRAIRDLLFERVNAWQ